MAGKAKSPKSYQHSVTGKAYMSKVTRFYSFHKHFYTKSQVKNFESRSQKSVSAHPHFKNNIHNHNTKTDLQTIEMMYCIQLLVWMSFPFTGTSTSGGKYQVDLVSRSETPILRLKEVVFLFLPSCRPKNPIQ